MVRLYLDQIIWRTLNETIISPVFDSAVAPAPHAGVVRLQEKFAGAASTSSTRRCIRPGCPGAARHSSADDYASRRYADHYTWRHGHADLDNHQFHHSRYPTGNRYGDSCSFGYPAGESRILGYISGHRYSSR